MVLSVFPCVRVTYNTTKQIVMEFDEMIANIMEKYIVYS